MTAKVHFVEEAYFFVFIIRHIALFKNYINPKQKRLKKAMGKPFILSIFLSIHSIRSML